MLRMILLSLLIPNMLQCRSTTDASALQEVGPNNVQVHAHRGGRNEGIENSIGSFLRSMDLGVDVLEFDVVGTDDSELIVKHDQFIDPQNCSSKADLPFLKRRSHVYFRTITLKEIQLLECVDKEGRKFTISSLDQVFAAIAEKLKTKPSNIKLNIETKISEVVDPREPADVQYLPVNDDDVRKEVAKLFDLAKKHDLLDRVIIQSFDLRSLRLAKDLSPKTPRSFLLMPGAGKRTPSQALALVDSINKADANLVQIFSPQQAATTYYGLTVNLIGDDSNNNVAAFHERHIQVIPWTVNEKFDWIRLTKMGVDAIITDNPSAFMTWRANPDAP